MSEKPGYFKIGLFVIVATILLVVAVVIFGAGLFREPKVYFETYFDSSVTGLSVGAPMLNRGVQLGRVEKITFVRDEYDVPADQYGVSKYGSYVVVVSSVDEEQLPAMTPEMREERMKELVDKGLRIRLSTNLLTGQGYLEGNYLDPERFPPLEIAWKPKRLYVPSAPGEFTTIKESIDSILLKLEQIDVQALTDSIKDTFESIEKSIDEANIPKVTAELTDLLHRLDRLIATQSPQIGTTIDNLKEITDNIKDLTEDLKRNPSELLFSKPPQRSEVLE